MSTAQSARVAIYGRYSTDRQSEHSIEDQLRICRDHAERQGWIVVAEFRDAAISGTTAERPGYKALQIAMRRGQIDIILAEALDRISRDQEHIAAFHKLVAFTGLRFVTLAEGAISTLHVGLKGTMNALFLKDLSDKTRRGMEGRLRAGRGIGRVPYGYRRVTGVLRPDGEVERGLREIVPEEAEVVRRIFSEFATGRSPMAIARRLNQDAVAGPQSNGWNQFAIRGRMRTNQGMLCNQLYVGEAVWNRRHRAVDPLTGHGSKRANPEDKVVVAPVPELRIIDDALWARAQRRLAEDAAQLSPEAPKGRFWDKRRPRHLLSGKIVCGVCGGNYSAVRSGYYSCNNADRHLCTNRTTANRAKLEAQVTTILAEQMMAPELAAQFADEFTAEWNRLAAQAGGAVARLRAKLVEVERQLNNLVEAISNGLRSASLQTKLSKLEAERDQLAQAVAAAKPSKVRLMPNLGATYRNTVARLREALTTGDNLEAVEAARALIARVVIHPSAPKKPPGVTIEGNLSAMLAAAQPDLPPHAAQILAEAAELAVKQGLGARGSPVSLAFSPRFPAYKRNVIPHPPPPHHPPDRPPMARPPPLRRIPLPPRPPPA